MREILFKAKMINDGEWVYGSLITNLNNMAFIGLNDCIYSTGFNNKPNAINSHIFSVDPETLCQYTEVDQNYDGIKIFDGDKLDFCVFDYNGNDKAYIGYVVYTYGTYLVIDINDEENLWELGWIMAQNDEAKVIGNIHDKESD